MQAPVGRTWDSEHQLPETRVHNGVQSTGVLSLDVMEQGARLMTAESSSISVVMVAIMNARHCSVNCDTVGHCMVVVTW